VISRIQKGKIQMLLRAVFRIAISAVLLATLQAGAEGKEPYKYFKIGNSADLSTKTVAGFALMGGGKDQDAAFQWMCKKSGGGDFLVIRASGSADYNEYIAGLCHQNSVATLVIPSREAAMDPFVATTIRNAEALFIAGGDQANYIRNWTDTPVQNAINELIQKGIPVGGTSAGLAVLGEFSYSALNDGNIKANLDSRQTLSDPYNDRVTITRNFLKVDLLQRTITDTHFAARDRLGRLLGFMARIFEDKSAEDVRGIGVDEKSVALLDADGSVSVVGPGSGAYFIHMSQRPDVCTKGVPLKSSGISVYKVAPGATFDVTSWQGAGGTAYDLQVEDGAVRSTSKDLTPYGSALTTSKAK
jgi:cyanophycinase